MDEDVNTDNSSIQKKNNIIVTKLLELFDILQLDISSRDDLKKCIEDVLFPRQDYREPKMVEPFKEILELVKKLKVTKMLDANNKSNIIIELHDTIGLHRPRTSCSGFNIFVLLIDAICAFLETKDITCELKNGISYSGSEKTCKNQNTKNIGSDLVTGGSKSRRKPARKTRRGHTRKSKSKSKSKPKTHRRKRHSRVRKHKKYTSRRRR